MKGRRGKENCKAEVKWQYRPHKASCNLAGISASSYLSGFSQCEQKGWAFTPLPCSGAGWELPWKGLNLRQEVLCTRSRPGGSLYQKPTLNNLIAESFLITFFSPCNSSLKDVGCTTLCPPHFHLGTHFTHSQNPLLSSTSLLSSLFYFFQLHVCACLR